MDEEYTLKSGSEIPSSLVTKLREIEGLVASMLKLYEKYRENLRNDLPSPEQLSSEETRLVIKPLPKDWGNELSQTHKGIERIGDDLMEDKESG